MNEYLEYACNQTLLIPLCPSYKLLLNGGYVYGTMLMIQANDKVSVAFHKAMTTLGEKNQFVNQSVIVSILCIGTERAMKIWRTTGYDPYLRKLINVAQNLEKIMNQCFDGYSIELENAIAKSQEDGLVVYELIKEE